MTPKKTKASSGELPEGCKEYRPKEIKTIKPAYTPAPWRADHNGVITGDSGLVSVAETYLVKIEATENIRMINEARANGRLIENAPVLLAALENAAHALEIAAGQLLDFERYTQTEPYCNGAALSAADRAREIIKKAIGGR